MNNIIYTQKDCSTSFLSQLDGVIIVKSFIPKKAVFCQNSFCLIYQHKACRMMMFLWAIMAFCFPSVTLNIRIVWTMSSEWPAIMQCPESTYVVSFKVIKQNLIINIISMKIMNMYNIRFIFIKHFQKFLCNQF